MFSTTEDRFRVVNLNCWKKLLISYIIEMIDFVCSDLKTLRDWLKSRKDE